MTTGTKIVGTTGGSPDYYMRKTWNGLDGKFDSSGKIRWNNYSMNLRIRSDQLGPWPPTANTITLVDEQPWSAADELRLQSKLVENIKGHQFNLAVDLAQANQLVTMCSRTIRSFGRSMLYLKRGNVSAALRELGVDGKNKKLKSKDVSGRWLEMQYGWLPAAGSCYEAAKAFEAISLGRSNRVVTKRKREHKQNGTTAATISMPSVVFHKAKIIAELEEELSFARTLGLTDPLQVAWELLPFSFVLDWFLPVGSYLENLAVLPNLNGRFQKTIYTGYDCFFNGSAGNPATFMGIRRTGHDRAVDRTVTASLTTQRPHFVNPITAMTYKRIANAVSLAHQLIGS